MKKIEALKDFCRRKRYGIPVEFSDEWQKCESKMKASTRIVDLGCGSNPHPLATVGVDQFIDPIHRHGGHGPTINPDQLKKQGCEFVKADLSQLPFASKEFDFAYSHHAFEHLPDPKSACKEMVRIAKSGVIITPAPFAEFAFGRPYHLWWVFARRNTIFFVRKTAIENCPFGDHPIMINKKWSVSKGTNPFDLLLNEGNWYRGRERMPRLQKKLRALWNSRSPIIDTVFNWENNFNCVVIHEDGTIEQ